MAGDRCDMCQEAEYDVSTIVRKDGQTTWLCWTCYPYAQAQYLAAVGWSVEPPTAQEPEAAVVAEEVAGPAETPVPRPRVVTNEEAATEGSADPEIPRQDPSDAGDQRGDDRVEPRSRAGAKSRPPTPGA